MSMPKPVGPNMATATPLGPPEPQTAQKQYAGSLDVDAQPSAARISLPGGAARKVSAPVRGCPGAGVTVGGSWRNPQRTGYGSA